MQIDRESRTSHGGAAFLRSIVSVLVDHRGTLYEVVIDPLAPKFITFTPLFGTRKKAIDKAVLFDQHGVIDLARRILHKGDSYLTVIGIEVTIGIIFHLREFISLGQISLHLLATPPSTARRAYQRFAVVDNGAVLI